MKQYTVSLFGLGYMGRIIFITLLLTFLFTGDPDIWDLSINTVQNYLKGMQ